MQVDQAKPWSGTSTELPVSIGLKIKSLTSYLLEETYWDRKESTIDKG